MKSGKPWQLGGDWGDSPQFAIQAAQLLWGGVWRSPTPGGGWGRWVEQVLRSSYLVTAERREGLSGAERCKKGRIPSRPEPPEPDFE